MRALFTPLKCGVAHALITPSLFHYAVSAHVTLAQRAGGSGSGGETGVWAGGGGGGGVEMEREGGG